MLTYSHEFWVMSERVSSLFQPVAMEFLRRVQSVILREKGRSCVIRKPLKVSSLLLPNRKISAFAKNVQVGSARHFLLWRFVCCCLAALMSLSHNVDCCHDSSGQLAFVFYGECWASLFDVVVIMCSWHCSFFRVLNGPQCCCLLLRVLDAAPCFCS